MKRIPVEILLITEDCIIGLKSMCSIKKSLSFYSSVFLLINSTSDMLTNIATTKYHKENHKKKSYFV